MATSQAAVNREALVQTKPDRAGASSGIDLILLFGIAVALGSVIAGVCVAGISIGNFFQPAGALIVLGGTLGVTLITTPQRSLVHCFHRVKGLISYEEVNREALIEEIVYYARVARRSSLIAIEPLLRKTTHLFLGDALQLALDIGNRAELRSVLETELRMRERQGEMDAKILEIAGALAPTIGIIGTVVGLMKVLRQFSNIQSVESGIGTAFVSTVYGLALANLLLLPAAHRIRARVAEHFEIQELIIEGVLALADEVHPALIRLRLGAYLPQRTVQSRDAVTQPAHES